METIRLSDGREFEVLSFATAGPSNAYLFIRVKMGFSEAAVEFSHGTDRIEYYPADGAAIALHGWTNLAYIVKEEDCVRVALTRPMNVEAVNNG